MRCDYLSPHITQRGMWPPDSASDAVIFHGGTSRLPSSSCLCQVPCLELWLLSTSICGMEWSTQRAGQPPNLLCKSPHLPLAAAAMGSWIWKLSSESSVWAGQQSSISDGEAVWLFLLLFSKALFHSCSWTLCLPSSAVSFSTFPTFSFGFWYNPQCARRSLCLLPS